MKTKIIIILIFVFTVSNLFSQENLFATIKENEAKCKLEITKRIKKRYGKKAVKRYNNFLFVHPISVKTLDHSKMDDDNIDESISNALKNHEVVKNMELTDSPHNQVIIYDDSLSLLGVDIGYICFPSPGFKELLIFYLNSNTDLLFFVSEGRLDYYVLIDNKVWMLKFNEDTKEYEKVEP